MIFHVFSKPLPGTVFRGSRCRSCLHLLIKIPIRYAHAADPEYSLRASSLPIAYLETPFCEPLQGSFPTPPIPTSHPHPPTPPPRALRGPRGPKGPWGPLGIIPKLFRMESCSEWMAISSGRCLKGPWGEGGGGGTKMRRKGCKQISATWAARPS